MATMKAKLFFIAYSILFFGVTIASIEGMDVFEVQLVWALALLSGVLMKGFVYQFMEIVILKK